MDHVMVGIHQPNLFPWLGYFNKIAKSDTFVFLDDVQIQKTGASFTNRVSIASGGAERFVTAPIRRHEGVWKVSETEFVDRHWIEQTIKTLQSSYARARHFNAEHDFIFELIRFDSTNLSVYNINFISNIARALGLSAELRVSSHIPIQTSDPTKRLIALVQSSGGNHYLSGSGGKAYQEAELFRSHGIELSYIDNSKLIYNQSINKGFVPGLSVLDAIFHIGMQATSELLHASGRTI